jgi:hypothetical protein
MSNVVAAGVAWSLFIAFALFIGYAFGPVIREMLP